MNKALWVEARVAGCIASCVPASMAFTASMVASALAMDYGDEVLAHDGKSGGTVLGATATNDGHDRETIHVRTRDGRDITVGDLEPGKSARVTVIERPGSPPLILFDRK
jgi:hypothetical protein